MTSQLPRRARSAAMFPGQGLTPRDVSRDEIAASAPELLALCEELLGADPFTMPAWPTSVAQPAIFCASLARWFRDREELAPDYLVGHSLGELTALTAAGALTPEDGLKLVVRRGRLTETAVRGTGTGMLAVAASRSEAEKLVRSGDTVIANDNSPRQVVLAGKRDRLMEIAALGRAAGIRTSLLPVEGAFHSPWMRPAVDEFTAELGRVAFDEPSPSVISCITCAPIHDPAAELARALTSPVRWRELVLQLANLGVERFIDVGPAAVLSKLVQRILRESDQGSPDQRVA